MHAEDMFELTQTDLFSEYRNFLTGIDFCIGELRARRSRRPVRLEIHLPRRRPATKRPSESGARCAVTATTGCALTAARRAP